MWAQLFLKNLWFPPESTVGEDGGSRTPPFPRLIDETVSAFASSYPDVNTPAALASLLFGDAQKGGRRDAPKRPECNPPAVAGACFVPHGVYVSGDLTKAISHVTGVDVDVPLSPRHGGVFRLPASHRALPYSSFTVVYWENAQECATRPSAANSRENKYVDLDVLVLRSPANARGWVADWVYWPFVYKILTETDRDTSFPSLFSDAAACDYLLDVTETSELKVAIVDRFNVMTTDEMGPLLKRFLASALSFVDQPQLAHCSFLDLSRRYGHLCFLTPALLFAMNASESLPAARVTAKKVLRSRDARVAALWRLGALAGTYHGTFEHSPWTRPTPVPDREKIQTFENDLLRVEPGSLHVTFRSASSAMYDAMRSNEAGRVFRRDMQCLLDPKTYLLFKYSCQLTANVDTENLAKRIGEVKAPGDLNGANGERTSYSKVGVELAKEFMNTDIEATGGVCKELAGVVYRKDLLMGVDLKTGSSAKLAKVKLLQAILREENSVYGIVRSPAFPHAYPSRIIGTRRPKLDKTAYEFHAGKHPENDIDYYWTLSPNERLLFFLAATFWTSKLTARAGGIDSSQFALPKLYTQIAYETDANITYAALRSKNGAGGWNDNEAKTLAAAVMISPQRYNDARSLVFDARVAEPGQRTADDAARVRLVFLGDWYKFVPGWHIRFEGVDFRASDRAVLGAIEATYNHVYRAAIASSNTLPGGVGNTTILQTISPRKPALLDGVDYGRGFDHVMAATDALLSRRTNGASFHTTRRTTRQHVRSFLEDLKRISADDSVARPDLRYCNLQDALFGTRPGITTYAAAMSYENQSNALPKVKVAALLKISDAAAVAPGWQAPVQRFVPHSEYDLYTRSFAVDEMRKIVSTYYCVRFTPAVWNKLNADTVKRNATTYTDLYTERQLSERRVFDWLCGGYDDSDKTFPACDAIVERAKRDPVCADLLESCKNKLPFTRWLKCELACRYLRRAATRVEPFWKQPVTAAVEVVFESLVYAVLNVKRNANDSGFLGTDRLAWPNTLFPSIASAVKKHADADVGRCVEEILSLVKRSPPPVVVPRRNTGIPIDFVPASVAECEKLKAFVHCTLRNYAGASSDDVARVRNAAWSVPGGCDGDYNRHFFASVLK